LIDFRKPFAGKLASIFIEWDQKYEQSVATPKSTRFSMFAGHQEYG
jgi:hypothetical protein